MNRPVPTALLLLTMALAAAGIRAATPAPLPLTWSSVVDNGDFMPTALCDPQATDAASPPCRTFNSYNQPSVNARGLVVFRARSRGGETLGEPVHGVYARDMAAAGPVIKILDRDTAVPPPANRGSLFTEPPAFPRIDIHSDTLATRGNHQPVWQVLNDAGETVEQVGTSGIYTDPFGTLITGASKLGGVSAFSFFQVPEQPGTYFDVFPGAPAVTDGNLIVFKGNYTDGSAARTGVYYRQLANAPIILPDRTALSPAGGDLPVVLIANNIDTLIPGTDTVFGSLAPPSAADGMAVFAGFDDEDSPQLGGIYLAHLTGSQPSLHTLVHIGERVPGQIDAQFNRLGEGVSFDGRFMAFWGAWGTATTTLVLQCPTHGNRDRVEYCASVYPNGHNVHVPVHQGIFVYDLRRRQLYAVATAPETYSDFLYWNYSGHVPGSSEGDGEPARWRASAFVAVSGLAVASPYAAHFRVAFKARTGEVVSGRFTNPVDGLYLGAGPGRLPLRMLVRTGMPGTQLDPRAFDPETDAPLPVTELGIERDGFRGSHLVITASMGTEETGWAGVYMTELRR